MSHSMPFCCELIFFFFMFLSLDHSILFYNEGDSNLDMFPLLKRILQDKIPVWIFRLMFYFCSFVPYET